MDFLDLKNLVSKLVRACIAEGRTEQKTLDDQTNKQKQASLEIKEAASKECEELVLLEFNKLINEKNQLKNKLSQLEVSLKEMIKIAAQEGE